MYENLHAPMPAYKEIKLYTGNGNRELAQKIADILHLELSGLKIEKFANGEIYCRFEESVRGDEVFIIQSITGSNVNDILMELLIAADAAKRASAASVTAVIPHRRHPALRLRPSGPQGRPARADHCAPGGQPARDLRRRPRDHARPAPGPDPGIL